MPGKREREEGVFSINELSPEARKRVLEEWRYKIWGQHDSDWLSETFKEILSERGFMDPKVYWSLSSCQGDGVAFEGYLLPPDFFKWIFSGDPKAKPFVKQAKSFVFLQDLVSIKVTHSGRHYHWNSMNVEMEVVGNEMDLVPEKHRADVQIWYLDKQDAFESWMRTKRNIEYDRNAPIRSWDERANDRSRKIKRGPKEWRPPVGPRPEPLNLPIPPEPELDIPIRIQRMMDQAVRKFSEIDAVVNDFETFVSGWVKDTSKELEKIGYGEMDYRQSDEAITEFLDENEFTFDENGEEL